jgi:flagellar biosynthesis protein FlhB
MGDQGEKTEEPTQQRLQKARREGRFPASRDFILSLQFASVVILATNSIDGLKSGISALCINLLTQAFASTPITPSGLVYLYSSLILPVFLKVLGMGAALVLLTLGIHLASTGFGLAVKQMMPDLQRLNLLSRFKQLPKENAANTVRTLLLIVLVAYLLFEQMRDQMGEVSNLASGSLSNNLGHAASLVHALAWRITLVLVAFGAFDVFRQRRKFRSQMRMTKQEIRDEMKDVEGNQQMKHRIRRLQRDSARKNMMKAVPKATAIIVNPTHFAVALHYDMNNRSIPSVVAKGKNYLAQLIRQRAIEHEVPIIENKPLAQALYHSVDIGQEIPPDLYRAVAEVLAHIYRTLNRQSLL